MAAALTITIGALALALRKSRTTATHLRTEIAQLREARLEQQAALTKRSELDTLKDEFISTVSHELRTPLTSIRGALGLLSSGMLGDLDPKAQNLLRIATSNTDRLVRLINDILDLERMESGRATLQVRRCNLAQLITHAVETMQPMADAALVTIAVTGTLTVNNHPLRIDADADRIQQVLTNLLSNAIKFSPPHSTIKLSVAAEATTITLRISDEGRGIPADKLDAIFDRFQQVEASDARQKGGTGLGLAICRTIVQQHNGTITAAQNPVTGATFTVTLPRTNAAALPTSATLPTANTSATILVCDDDASIRTIVAEHLRQQGYTVLEADRGEQAITLATENSIDAILLDLYMPGLSGWETMQRLKAAPATQEIPIVILSGLSPYQRPELATDAQGWVQKPFNENLLLGELARVLHGTDGPAIILLVEDDTDLASVITTGFQQATAADKNKNQGVEIIHASTRHQAIALCTAQRPDLILLDLTLPDGDGFSLVDWLRQQPALRTLPLVVYSGREVSDTERDKLRLGPTQFLTKARVQPGDVEDLVLAMLSRLRDPQPTVKI